LGGKTSRETKRHVRILYLRSAEATSVLCQGPFWREAALLLRQQRPLRLCQLSDRVALACSYRRWDRSDGASEILRLRLCAGASHFVPELPQASGRMEHAVRPHHPEARNFAILEVPSTARPEPRTARGRRTGRRAARLAQSGCAAAPHRPCLPTVSRPFRSAFGSGRLTNRLTPAAWPLSTERFTTRRYWTSS